MNFKVRKLESNDLNKGFLETLANLTTVDLTHEEAREIFSKLDNNSDVFVAETEDGMIVGTTMLFVTQRFIHKGGRVGHLEDVATRKGFEGRGVGSALVRAAIEETRAKGCYKVILNCNDKNVPFYEKLGFRKKENEMRLDL